MTDETLLSRDEFRKRALDRESGDCLVPWCPERADEVHHVIERSLWEDGGYYLRNAAAVCNQHHQYAEANYIPPQAFWRWLEVEPLTPDGIPTHINKWGTSEQSDGRGETFETPPWDEYRDEIKYQSTRHILPLYWQSKRGNADERTGRDDTALTTVEPFLGTPLVATIKLDGSNAMLVRDADEPVRARNGKDAEHESFSMLKAEFNKDHWRFTTLDPHLQIFGEWMYAKHSIHYGCDGCCAERNQGPPLDAYFYIFNIFDNRYNVWLSWPEVEDWADRLEFPTAPVVTRASDEREDTFRREMTRLAEDVVDEGHEGLVVRSRFPYHYAQFDRRLGKYVRPHHVQTDEHWSHQPTVRNVVRNE